MASVFLRFHQRHGSSAIMRRKGWLKNLTNPVVVQLDDGAVGKMKVLFWNPVRAAVASLNVFSRFPLVLCDVA